MLPLAIPALVLAVLAVVFGTIFYVFRRSSQKQIQNMQERFPAAKIITGANFFGQLSKGLTQIRGNGTLVLTDAEIIFEKWMPRTEYRIPLNRIHSIETPKVFLSKSVGRPLLKINYEDETGRSDAIAWYVKDVASLKDLIENSTK